MTKDRELLEKFARYWNSTDLPEEYGYVILPSDIDSFLATLPEEKEEKIWFVRKYNFPVKDGRYLVIITQGERHEVNIAVWLNRLNGFDSFLDDFITHWIPLPEFNPSNQ